jgi:putative membrane protein
MLRIQEPPWKLPMSAVLWEGTSHVVFGLALEGFRAFVRLAAGCCRDMIGEGP